TNRPPPLASEWRGDALEPRCRELGERPLRLTRATWASVSQPGAKAQRVLGQDLPLRALRQPRALHHLLDTFRPRGVAVRPVRGEEPEILPQLLHTELERALPRVDGVEVASFREHLARQALEIRDVAGRHDVVRVQAVEGEGQPATSRLDDPHAQ